MKSFIAILAKTTRSQAYIQSFVKSKIIPSFVAVLDELPDSTKIRPENKYVSKVANVYHDFGRAHLQTQETIVETLSRQVYSMLLQNPT